MYTRYFDRATIGFASNNRCEALDADPRLQTGGTQTVTVVPAEAVRTAAGVSRLFVVVGDHTEERVVSVVERDPNFRTDRLAGALVDFGGGRHLNFTCSTQLVPYQSVQALGTKGRVEIIIPFNAPQGEATTILIDTGKALDRSSARRRNPPTHHLNHIP